MMATTRAHRSPERISERRICWANSFEPSKSHQHNGEDLRCLWNFDGCRFLSVGFAIFSLCVPFGIGLASKSVSFPREICLHRGTRCPIDGMLRINRSQEDILQRLGIRMAMNAIVDG